MGRIIHKLVDWMSIAMAVIGAPIILFVWYADNDVIKRDPGNTLNGNETKWERLMQITGQRGD